MTIVIDSVGVKLSMGFASLNLANMTLASVESLIVRRADISHM